MLLAVNLRDERYRLSKPSTEFRLPEAFSSRAAMRKCSNIGNARIYLKTWSEKNPAHGGLENGRVFRT
jgi:hypothetical protein